MGTQKYPVVCRVPDRFCRVPGTWSATRSGTQVVCYRVMAALHWHASGVTRPVKLWLFWKYLLQNVIIIVKNIFKQTVITIKLLTNARTQINVRFLHRFQLRFNIFNEDRLMRIITRKPCYRKDDRAMRPIAYMGALKIFGTPCMATPTDNFPDIFNGLLFRSIPWLCLQNLKFTVT